MVLHRGGGTGRRLESARAVQTSHQHADCKTYTQSNPHAYCTANTYTYASAYSHSIANGNANADTNADPHADRRCNADCNSPQSTRCADKVYLLRRRFFEC